MPPAKRKTLPTEILLQLKRRLDSLPPRHEERKERVASMADLYRVSAVTSTGHCGNCTNPIHPYVMEESCYRSTIFSLDADTGSQREYIHWLLRNCSGGADPESMFTEEAIDLPASKLRTPLQVEQHLKLALEAGYQTGVRPVPVEVAESVLSKKLDDLEPTLTRHGYKMRDLAEELGVKSREIKALFHNQLEPGRSKELLEKMLAAGLPI